MSKWGVPDWRDGRAYPDPEEVTDRQWWWQFVRRRADYRELWSKWSRMGEVSERRVATDDPHCLRIRFQMSVLLDPSFSDPSDWEIAQHRFPANAGRDPDRHSPMKLIRQIAEIEPDRVEVEIQEQSRIDEMQRASGVKLYSFDLSKPLEPQIARAREYLLGYQQEFWGRQNTRKPRRDQWPLFLRALDARDAGATFAEMAATFWPGQQKTPQSARDTHKAACDLRENFPI